MSSWQWLLQGPDGPADFDWAAAWSSGTSRYGRLVAALLVIVVSGGIFWAFRGYARLFRLWRRKLQVRTRSEITCDYFEELLFILEKKGFTKSRFETPLEFSRRVGHRLGTELPIAITEAYYRARFGGHEPHEEELVRLRASLGQLRAVRV